MIQKNAGFTLLEVLIAFGLLMVLMVSLMHFFLGIKSIGSVNKGHVQAMQVVRGKIEALKGSAFALVANEATVVPYDAGVDGRFGTADDLTGALTVAVGDFLDMDGDGNTVETSIDVNNDLVNDGTTRPVRVSFSWTRRLLGSEKNFSYSVDALIVR